MILGEKYDESRKLVKKVCRKKKREHIERRIQAIENNDIKEQAKEFYKGIKNEKRRNLHIFCKNKKGELVGEMEESLNRWAEYFQEVYTGGINEEAYTPVTENEDLPTQQEIAEIIRKLKN
ncbi:hypothetical protein ILUMI_25738 [Ignelater luminosus]|uniref:Uncharacterized protein n=1 Tax=Ignelater luminosus TaxID=2038154 RepID=A0A8K0C4H1_IGNLU|nr:hypothetical protein ILUMI_25738 [Ignelater luminosus]